MVIDDQLSQTKSSEAVAEDNFLPVGHYRPSDNTVSIGRGERLSRGVYDNIMTSKTPLQCVGNTVMAVFGEKTLIKSTVTGRVSGRTKAALKNNTVDGQVENNLEFQQLDPTKLSACEDVFVKWLRTKYTEIIMAGNKKWNKDIKASEAGEIKRFRTYVTKKISYLKRPPPEKKPRKKEVDIDSENDEERDNTGHDKQKVNETEKDEEMVEEQNNESEMEIDNNTKIDKENDIEEKNDIEKENDVEVEKLNEKTNNVLEVEGNTDNVSPISELGENDSLDGFETFEDEETEVVIEKKGGSDSDATVKNSSEDEA